MMTWMQARQAMITGHAVKLIDWPDSWQLTLSLPGNPRSEYVLVGNGELLSMDWVPERTDLKHKWELVVNDESHLWNAPF